MRVFAAITLAGLLTFLSLDVGHAETRVALVIGNGAYQYAPRLTNPRNDAEDVVASLKRSGFETIVGLDMSRLAMEDAAIRFARAARSADVAMFYYSGHAIQVAGVNYLAPVDLKITDENDLRRMIRLDDVVADLQQAKNLRVLVVDACRDNPLAEELKRSIGATRAMSVQRGLAKIDAPQGMIVAYATQAGRTADDGNGRNSPYTAAFLRRIEVQEEIGTIFRRISADVYQATNQQQLPELSLSLIGEFYLHGKLETSVRPSTALTPLSKLDPCAAAADHWKSAETIGTTAAFEDHINRFPGCAFVGLAKARLDQLKNKIAAVAPPVPPALPKPASEADRGWFGARIQLVTEDIADSLNVKPALGALVASVVGNGPAKLAGIEPGDVIVAFDGKEIKEYRDLPRAVADTPIGNEVEVAILRKGREEKKTVKLVRLQDGEKQAPLETKLETKTDTAPQEQSVVQKMVGLDLANMRDELRKRFKIKTSLKGVVITAVDTEAVKIRLSPGEVIVGVALEPVGTIADLQKGIDHLKKAGRKSALLLVCDAEGQSRFVILGLQ